MEEAEEAYFTFLAHENNNYLVHENNNNHGEQQLDNITEGEQ
jgi:hypothetical protein